MSAFNVKFVGGPFDGDEKTQERAPQDGEKFVCDCGAFYRYSWAKFAFVFAGYVPERWLKPRKKFD